MEYVLFLTESGAGEGRRHVRHHHTTRPLNDGLLPGESVILSRCSLTLFISLLCIISDMSVFLSVSRFDVFICFLVHTVM